MDTFIKPKFKLGCSLQQCYNTVLIIKNMTDNYCTTCAHTHRAYIIIAVYESMTNVYNAVWSKYMSSSKNKILSTP